MRDPRRYDQCYCGRMKARKAETCRSCYVTRTMVKPRSTLGKVCPLCRKPKSFTAKNCRMCWLAANRKSPRTWTMVHLRQEQKQKLVALAGPHRSLAETVGLLIDAAYAAKKGRAA